MKVQVNSQQLPEKVNQNKARPLKTLTENELSSYFSPCASYLAAVYFLLFFLHTGVI